MSAKPLLLISTMLVAALPAAAGAEGLSPGPRDGITEGSFLSRHQKDGDPYGDRNRGGPYGFYSYPSRHHVDGGRRADRGDNYSPRYSRGISPYCDNCHGSAYYGRDYGAPYFGGGYYYRGVYYRERRH